MPDRDAATRDLRRIVRRYGSDPKAKMPRLTLDECACVEALEERLTRDFGDTGDLAARWLTGFNALLGNRCPIDLLRRGQVRVVVDALDATEAGTFS